MGLDPIFRHVAKHIEFGVSPNTRGALVTIRGDFFGTVGICLLLVSGALAMSTLSCVFVG